jgi:hypothetical protein
MVNKGLPWTFVLGMSVLVLLAIFGLWSSFSGGMWGFTLPFFLKPTLLLGLGLFLYSYFIHSKPLGWVVWVVAILFLLFAWFGPTRTSQITEGTGVVLNSAADTMTNLITTGTTKSAADLAAEQRARADELRLQAELDGIKEAAAAKEAAKDAPLTPAAFTTRTPGKFIPLQIKSGTQVGPITMYAACDLQWTKSGFGMIRILTRPDFKSEPVEATLTDVGYSIKETGHPDLPAQMFFEAVQGDIQIEMVRYDNGTNVNNPCK